MRALSFLIPLTTRKHEKKVTWMVATDKQNFLLFVITSKLIDINLSYGDGG